MLSMPSIFKVTFPVSVWMFSAVARNFLLRSLIKIRSYYRWIFFTWIWNCKFPVFISSVILLKNWATNFPFLVNGIDSIFRVELERIWMKEVNFFLLLDLFALVQDQQLQILSRSWIQFSILYTRWLLVRTPGRWAQKGKQRARSSAFSVLWRNK